MIIKATLCTLILMLVLVISTSYYVNKEGFDDITNKAILPGVPTPVPAPSPVPASNANKPILPGVPTPDSQPAPVKPILPGVPTPAAGPSATPQRVDLVPEVSISGTGYDAMSLQERADLLRDIQKVVRNEILSNRYTTPMINDSKDIKITDSTSQGGDNFSNAYKVASERLAKGLQRILCDRFDCSKATPYSNNTYRLSEEYYCQRDFGRVALGTIAHSLFGHVDATAAITNDLQFVWCSKIIHGNKIIEPL
jgi:hypothetical protein